jgi:prophage regulatory protein
MVKAEFFELPKCGYVRLPAVLRVVPVSKSTWWAGVRTGRFPKSVKLSERITAWRAEDIHELLVDLGRRETAA